jgi:hypothetical protein
MPSKDSTQIRSDSRTSLVPKPKDKCRTHSKTRTSDAEAIAAAPTDPTRTGSPSPTTEPEVIRYRLRHLPQAAFAATRPNAMVQILEPANRPRKGREVR